MNWDVSRDGHINTHYFKSYWLQNIFWTLLPSFMGRVFGDSSISWRGARDIEASGPSDLGQASSTPQDQAGQEVHIDDGTNENTKTLKEDSKNKKVFICLVDKRSSSWRLSHAKVQLNSKNEAQTASENQRQKVEDNNTSEDRYPGLSGMDKSLFLALRQKLLCRQMLYTWRWLTPTKLSGIEFWEVRFYP